MPELGTSVQKTDRWPVLVFLVALTVRLFYLFENKGSPFFDHPRLDALFHDIWAQSIANGNIIGDKVFFRAPLYPYLLGFLYTLPGNDHLNARIFQHLLGSFSVVLTYFLSRRMLGCSTAILASLIMALYSVLIFFEGELLFETLLIFLCLSWLVILYSAVEKPSTPKWIAAGFLLGLVAITRPTLVPVGIAVSLCAVWTLRESFRDRRARAQILLIILASMLIPIVPVTVRNYLVEHDFVLIASQGGLNFYIGNNPAANGFSSALPEERGTDWENRDVSYMLQKESGRTLKPSEESNYWYEKGFRFIVDNPVLWAELMSRKAYLFWNEYEIPNNRNYYFSEQFSSFLRFNPLGFGIIGPLGLVGMLLLSRQQSARMLLVFAAGFFLVTILFFVCDRFRLPIVPVCCIFAAYCALSIWKSFKSRQFMQASLIIAACLLLGIAFNTNLIASVRGNFAREYHALGIVNLEQADYRLASTNFATAESLNSNLPNLRVDWAVADWMSGQKERAVKRLKEEITLYPNSFAGLVDLSLFYFELGELDSSIAYGHRSLRIKPYVAVPYTTIARAFTRKGRVEEARSMLRKGAEECGNEFLYGQYLLAGVDLSEGKSEQARNSYASILRTVDASPQPAYEPEFSFSEEYRYGQSKKYIKGRTLYGLGLSWASSGKLDSAETYMRRATFILPDESDIWADLGVALLRSKQLAGAEDAMRKANALNGSNYLYWFNLGVVLFSERKVAAADSAFTTSLSCNPSFEPAREYLKAIRKEPVSR